MDNIEKRPYAGPSKYIGYSPRGTYRISKCNDKPGAVWWVAVHTDGVDVIHARTLLELGRKLAKRA